MSDEGASAGVTAGDRVLVHGKHAGTVRFAGQTKFKRGLWVGIEMDRPIGKNDGEVRGTRYFTCAPHHGVFVHPDQLQRFDRESQAASAIQSAARMRQAKKKMKAERNWRTWNALDNHNEQVGRSAPPPGPRAVREGQPPRPCHPRPRLCTAPPLPPPQPRLLLSVESSLSSWTRRSSPRSQVCATIPALLPPLPSRRLRRRHSAPRGQEPGRLGQRHLLHPRPRLVPGPVRAVAHYRGPDFAHPRRLQARPRHALPLRGRHCGPR